jgi:hypothetical protein
MRNRIFLISWIMTMELLIPGLVTFAQGQSVIYHEQITYDVSGLHIAPCPLPGIIGDTWRFTNSTSDTIYLRFYACVGKQDPFFYILAAGDSTDHTIGGIEAFIIVTLPRMGGGTYCDRVHPPGCPALSQWGILIL